MVQAEGSAYEQCGQHVDADLCRVVQQILDLGAAALGGQDAARGGHQGQVRRHATPELVVGLAPALEPGVAAQVAEQGEDGDQSHGCAGEEGLGARESAEETGRSRQVPCLYGPVVEEGAQVRLELAGGAVT